jgi:CBS domain-containing protein
VSSPSATSCAPSPRGADLDADRAADVMTYDITFVDSNDTVERVADFMIEGEVRHVAVHESDDRTGVISMRDVVRVLVAASTASRA